MEAPYVRIETPSEKYKDKNIINTELLYNKINTI